MSKSFVVAAIRELAATNNSIRCVMREVGGAVALVKAIATLQKNGTLSLSSGALTGLTIGSVYAHTLALAEGTGNELPPSATAGWTYIMHMQPSHKAEVRKALAKGAFQNISERLGDITSYLDD